MVEIQHPKSIFGKVPLINEQSILIDVTGDVTKGVSLINPLLVGMPEFFIKFKSEKERIEKMKDFFITANKKLESIGV